MTNSGRNGFVHYLCEHTDNEPPIIGAASIDLDEDIRFLRSFGIGLPALHKAQTHANRFDVSAAHALISNGIISESNYYSCVAFELGVEFVDEVSCSSAPFFKAPRPAVLAKMARMAMAQNIDDKLGSRLIYIAPDCAQLPQLKQLLAGKPELAERLRVTTPSAMMNNLNRRSAPSLLRAAKTGLLNQFPDFSALRVVTVRQALLLFISIQILALMALSHSQLILVALHLMASLFYFGCIALRLCATLTFKSPPKVQSSDRQQVSNDDVPIYSVMVAIYKEAGQVDGLVDALLALDWPRERLEIKLVCEEDDGETIAAVKTALLRVKTNIVTLVEVPVSEPRTKPKALNYALPLCAGRLLVIYDAEDRPDPGQLQEAFLTFKNGEANIGCVQAPLVIHNNRESWLSSMFAVEYSSLFEGLQPMLARYNAPIPLGGTSNHFKRSVLEKIGAWDPYNVTEDADLGIRLARAGYVIKTISRPTYEEAPVKFSVWVKQRTRWYKGWYQTWLVHMRHPIALARDLGLKGTFIFHMMISGMIVSSLVHPLLIYFILSRFYEISQQGFVGTVVEPLFLLDVATIALGYGAFAALAWQTLALRNLTHLRSVLWGIPVYWMLLAIAAWRAVWHLIWRPHEWEKTPHRLRENFVTTSTDTTAKDGARANRALTESKKYHQMCNLGAIDGAD